MGKVNCEPAFYKDEDEEMHRYNDVRFVACRCSTGMAHAKACIRGMASSRVNLGDTTLTCAWENRAFWDQSIR